MQWPAAPRLETTGNCRDRMAQKMMEAGDERILRELDRMISNEELRREIVEPPQVPISNDNPDDEAADMHEDDLDDSGNLGQ